MSSVSASGMDNPCSMTTSSGWTDKNLCGHGGMIAIIVPTHDPNLERDLDSHNSNFGLPACTISNGCLDVVKPYGSPNTQVIFDVSSYVEQAHETAPGAKILVVEAKSISWQDMWNAEHWTQSLPEIEKTVSASWSKIVIELELVLKQN
jgi:subtilase family serine protease